MDDLAYGARNKRGDEDAVDDGKAREQLADLIGAPQTTADPLVDRKRRYILAEKADEARRWREVAGDRGEQRRLPPPGQADDPDLERHSES